MCSSGAQQQASDLDRMHRGILAPEIRRTNVDGSPRGRGRHPPRTGPCWPARRAMSSTASWVAAKVEAARYTDDATGPETVPLAEASTAYIRAKTRIVRERARPQLPSEEPPPPAALVQRWLCRLPLDVNRPIDAESSIGPHELDALRERVAIAEMHRRLIEKKVRSGAESTSAALIFAELLADGSLVMPTDPQPEPSTPCFEGPAATGHAALLESVAVRARAAELLGDAEGMHVDVDAAVELSELTGQSPVCDVIDERMELDDEQQLSIRPPRTAAAAVVAAQLETSRRLRRRSVDQ